MDRTFGSLRFVGTSLIVISFFMVGCSIEREELSQNQKDVLLYLLDDFVKGEEQPKTGRELGLTITEVSELRLSGWIVNTSGRGETKYTISVTGCCVAEGLKEEKGKIDDLRTKYIRN